MKREIDSIEPKLAKAVFQAFATGAFISGRLTKEDLSDPDLLLSKIKKLAESAKISIIVDHRKTILEHAQKYHSTGQLELSLVFYAMFFEHTINHIIHETLLKRKLAKSTVNQVLRTASIDAKFGWLLDLIALPSFNEAHKKVVMLVANERNAFVHYKWNPEPDDLASSESDAAKIKALLAQAKKAVAYMRRFESKCLFNNQKKKMRRTISAR